MKPIFTFCACVMLAMTTFTVAGVQDSVRTVKIDPKVEMRDGVYLENPDGMWAGAVFGLSGAIASAAATDDEEFLEELKKNNVHVDRLVHQKFSEELKKSNIFKQIAAANPDATFHLKVEQYGMGCPAFSMDLRPILEVIATLQAKDGKVLWEESEKVNSLDERLPAYGWDAYTVKGELFQTGFSKAAELVSAELIEKLKNPEGHKHKDTLDAAPPRTGGSSSPKPGNSAAKKGM